MNELPTEILLYISEYCEGDDLLSYRSVSKRFHEIKYNRVIMHINYSNLLSIPDMTILWYSILLPTYYILGDGPLIIIIPSIVSYYIRSKWYTTYNSIKYI